MRKLVWLLWRLDILLILSLTLPLVYNSGWGLLAALLLGIISFCLACMYHQRLSQWHGFIILAAACVAILAWLRFLAPRLPLPALNAALGALAWAFFVAFMVAAPAARGSSRG